MQNQIPVPTFSRELQRVAPNDTERSRILGISSASIQRARRGLFGSTLMGLLRRPDLLRALADDADALLLTEPPDVLTDQPVGEPAAEAVAV